MSETSTHNQFDFKLFKGQEDTVGDILLEVSIKIRSDAIILTYDDLRRIHDILFDAWMRTDLDYAGQTSFRCSLDGEEVGFM